MKRTIGRGAKAVYGLAIVAGLSFGASQAFASSVAAREHTNLGPCTSTEECHERCVLHGGFQGTCIASGTCLCAY